jgi:N-acetylglucosaminyldiphosphoundecaprenol N-acetyl-beta-D-mannosaminyltransferase
MREDTPLPAVCLLGVRIHTLSVEQLLQRILASITNQEQLVIANVNVHALNLAYGTPRLRNFLNHADVVFCDGFGVKWGGRLLGLDIRHRYTPPDWLVRLSELCVQHHFSLFLLGARPGVAEQAARRLKEHSPGVELVGVYHGYFDKRLGSPESEQVIAQINSASPHILIVGFGMPLQEFWIEENQSRISANIIIPVGAALDYIAGEVPRGPRWMTDHGFEWLARLVIEPRRLWRRYIIGNPLFLWRVLKQRFGLLRLEP